MWYRKGNHEDGEEKYDDMYSLVPDPIYRGTYRQGGHLGNESHRFGGTFDLAQPMQLQVWEP